MKIISKKVFIFGIVAIVILAGVVAVLQQFGDGQKVTPGNNKNTPVPESQIGKTSVDELRGREGLVGEEKIDDNHTKFEFDSGLYLHPDTIIAQDDVVVYEADVVNPKEYIQTPYPHIVEYLSKYGAPPLIFQGSWRYGPFVRTYVYPNLGFSFVGIPATDEVLEFEYFMPMSAEEYSNAYGGNIRQEEAEEKESL